MDPEHPYQVPDFIIQNLNEGKPMDEQQVREVQSILHSTAKFSYPEASTDSCWQKLRSRIDAPMYVSKSPEPRKFAMFKWAAAAIIVLTMGLGIWQYTTGSDNFTAIYKTGLETKEIKLPDGTIIRLNHFTELEVTQMNDEQRVVVMKDGEAFFNVVHNELPFCVKTGKGDVMVTGTEFNVKSRQQLPFSVFLKTGKINFKSTSTVFKLKPGECVKENTSHLLEITKANDNAPYAWLQDKLVFNGQALADIVKELEAVYQVKFVYDNSLSSEKFNLVCDNKLDAKQVADLLSKVVNSKVSVE
jgi:transmembrane sensor